MNAPDRLPFIEPRRRAGGYTPPGAQMAPLVDLLARQPVSMSHELVTGLKLKKDRAWVQALLEQMMKDNDK